MSDEASFGILLRQYRAAANLTQEELAERAGLSAQAISALERGARRSPRTSTVELLAATLKLDPAQRRSLVAAARCRPALNARPAGGEWAPLAPEPRVVAALRVPPDLHLPATPFVGRTADLTRVCALLARPGVRLVTVTGPPGAGKTRLALEAAASMAGDYPDGAWAVALGPLREPAQVLPAIRQALGLDEAADVTPLETVAAHLRDRRLLLLLDNFEHLLAAAPELAGLLARCRGLRALVTSRATLRLRAEHELPLAPLQLPSADLPGGADPWALRDVASVRLFLDRAEAAAPDFRLTAGNAGAVASICRRLDGLPLALELAAPWLKLLTPREVLERLDRRLELLVDGPRDLPERQRTMRAALSWSCELLAPAPLALLRRLTVFAGSAPVDGREQVCDASEAWAGGRGVLPNLAVLADHSLVRRLSVDPEEPRVTLLESVREFGQELLVAAGEEEAAADAHLDHYVAMAERAAGEMRGPAQSVWLERLRREHDNMTAALDWAAGHGRTERGLRLARGLRAFWDFTGHRREGLVWLERLLAAPGPVDPRIRGEALDTAASLAWRLGSYELSVTRQREGLEIYRQLRDPRGIANAIRGLGIGLDGQGAHEEARERFEEAVSLMRELDDGELLASALLNLGVHVARYGDPHQATPLYEEALTMYRARGNALSTAHCLINLGNRARADGKLALAEARHEEAAAIGRRLDSPFHVAAALVGLADVARSRGDAAATGVRCREGLELFARSGERQGVAACLRLLGWVACAHGDAISGARLYGAGDALWPDAAAADDEDHAHARAGSALRERLGADGFTAAYEAGGRLSLEEAVAEASARA